MKDRLGNEVPKEALAFARWLEQRGWHYLREHVPAGEYEEDGEVVAYEAYWSQQMWHEKPPAFPREEGIWFWCMTVSDSLIQHEAAWPRLLDFAATCSEDERTSCRVPFYDYYHSGFARQTDPGDTGITTKEDHHA